MSVIKVCNPSGELKAELNGPRAVLMETGISHRPKENPSAQNRRLEHTSSLRVSTDMQVQLRKMKWANMSGAQAWNSEGRLDGGQNRVA